MIIAVVIEYRVSFYEHLTLYFCIFVFYIADWVLWKMNSPGGFVYGEMRVSSSLEYMGEIVLRWCFVGLLCVLCRKLYSYLQLPPAM